MTMAAHIYTVLKQVVARPDAEIPHLKNGLSYAPFGDNMEDDDWRQLNDALDAGDDTALRMVKALLPIYEQKWAELGEPRSSDDWMENKYRYVRLHGAEQ